MFSRRYTLVSAFSVGQEDQVVSDKQEYKSVFAKVEYVMYATRNDTKGSRSDVV